MATCAEDSDIPPAVTPHGAADAFLAHLTLALRMPATTAMLRGTRAAVRGWLEAVAEPVGSWDAVVTELVANAITSSPAGGHVTVSMRLASYGDIGDIGDIVVPRVVCSVSNDGVWGLAGLEPPVPLDLLVARSSSFDVAQLSGRGLRIVSALTSGGEVSVEGGRTTVVVWLDRSPDVWFADVCARPDRVRCRKARDRTPRAGR